MSALKMCRSSLPKAFFDSLLVRRKLKQLIIKQQTRTTKCRAGGDVKCKNPVKLAEVGKFEAQLKTGEYPVAQCFLHKTFAYRGIVLFPWKAQLIDKSVDDKERNVPYYQVLMDDRDFKYANTHSKMLEFSRTTPTARFGITGLDHVSHEDIIPYSSTEQNVIKHPDFHRFFVVRKLANKGSQHIVPKLGLEHWKRRHLPWLKKTRVNRMTTEKVRITATAFYMGRKRLTRWWRYSIRIDNLGKDSLMVKGQRWGIYTGRRRIEAVQGLGILRNLPVLSARLRAIQYSSHVSLLAARGQMWGYYHVQRQPGGNSFLCPVPSFALESTLTPSPLHSVFV